MLTHTIRAGAPAVVLALACAAQGATIGYVEDFANDTANWKNSANADVTFAANGGPDGGSYASASFNFAGTNAQSTPAILRCQSNFNSSGGNFFGNWITDGVATLNFWFRHDARGVTGGPVALSVFSRVAVNPAPGAIGIVTPDVPADTWTFISLPVTAPPFQFFEGGDFNQIFSQVARLQFGVLPGSLAGQNITAHFDIDKVTLTPAPGIAGLAGVAGLMGLRRRR